MAASLNNLVELYSAQGRYAEAEPLHQRSLVLSSAIDLQLESFVCYLNGARPESVRQPRHIAGWYYPAPYGIYQTKDGELAISLASMAVLSEALSLPELASVTEPEAFARNEALAGLVAGKPFPIGKARLRI